MKLIEAIELYRSKPQSDYKGENWVRLGQYLEPHLDEILLLIESRDVLMRQTAAEAREYIYTYGDTEYQEGKKAMFQFIFKKLFRTDYV